MSTSGDNYPMAAEHRRTIARQSSPPPPSRPVRSESRGQVRRRHRRTASQYSELGRRFASWALAQGYPPANFGSTGRGWKIGPLHPGSGGPFVSDPGPGEAMRMMRGPANWYVLHNGKVTTDAIDGDALVGSHPDTSRFIQVVLANWGCDLGSGPGLGSSSGPDAGPSQFELYVAQQQGARGAEWAEDLGYASPGWDTAGFLGATARPARPTPRRRPSMWRRFLDFLEDMGF